MHDRLDVCQVGPGAPFLDLWLGLKVWVILNWLSAGTVTCHKKMKAAGSSICGMVMACHSAHSCCLSRSAFDSDTAAAPPCTASCND